MPPSPLHPPGNRDLEALIAEREAAQAAALMPQKVVDDTSSFASDGVVPPFSSPYGLSAGAPGQPLADPLLDGNTRMAMPGNGDAGDGSAEPPTFLDKIAGLWHWPGGAGAGAGAGASGPLPATDHIAGMTQSIGGS